MYDLITAYGGLIAFTTFLLGMIFIKFVMQLSCETCNNGLKINNRKIFYINRYTYRMTQILLKSYVSLFSLFFTNGIFIGILLAFLRSLLGYKNAQKANTI